MLRTPWNAPCGGRSTWAVVGGGLHSPNWVWAVHALLKHRQAESPMACGMLSTETGSVFLRSPDVLFVQGPISVGLLTMLEDCPGAARGIFLTRQEAVEVVSESGGAARLAGDA